MRVFRVNAHELGVSDEDNFERFLKSSHLSVIEPHVQNRLRPE